MLIRCFPRKELSSENASGVREANSSRDEEGALSWGLQALVAPPLAVGLQAEVKREGEERRMGQE